MEQQGRRILVVEDETDSRELLQAALALQGYTVEGTGSAEDAAAILDARSFDLVVADWDLPGRSGATLAARAATRSPRGHAPLLIVTAHPDPSGVEGLDVMHKPLDMPGFLAQVKQLLEHADAAQPAAAGAPAEADVELVLYVAADAPASVKARRTIEAVLRGFEPEGIDFTVCDIAQHPLRGEADRVVFSPTLVKRRPAPRTWFLGDLSKGDALRDLLLLYGARQIAG